MHNFSSPNSDPMFFNVEQWHRFLEERDHMEKRIQNAGVSTCIQPPGIQSTDSSEEKLNKICEQHKYLECRIRSVQQLLQDLNVALIPVSPVAAVSVRNAMRSLNLGVDTFKLDARHAVKKQSDIIQKEVDGIEAQRIEKQTGTSPGLEHANMMNTSRAICSNCGVDWVPNHHRWCQNA